MKRKLLEMRFKSLKGKCNKMSVEFKLYKNNKMLEMIEFLDSYSKSMTDETFSRKLDELDEIYAKYKMLHDVKAVDKFIDKIQEKIKR